MKAHQISFWFFIGLIIASIAIFLVFFMDGYSDVMMGKNPAPEHMDLLLGWMYALAGICIAATVFGAIMNVVDAFGAPKGINITGVPTTLISVVSLVLFFGSIIVAWAMSSTEPVLLANGKSYDIASDLILTDVSIYSIGFLMVITILVLLVNLTGVLKK